MRLYSLEDLVKICTLGSCCNRLRLLESWVVVNQFCTWYECESLGARWWTATGRIRTSPKRLHPPYSLESVKRLPYMAKGTTDITPKVWEALDILVLVLKTEHTNHQSRNVSGLWKLNRVISWQSARKQDLNPTTTWYWLQTIWTARKQILPQSL